MAVDRRRIATALTAVVVAAVLLWAMLGRRPQSGEPETLVWTLIEAAQNGEVDRYLACFGPALRGQLEATVTEMSRPGFSDYLRSSSALLTGVAVYDVAKADSGRASLTVEYVYRDTTERQRMELELARGSWIITGLEPSKRARPLIPYGAPAAPMPEPAADETPSAAGAGQSPDVTRP